MSNEPQGDELLPEEAALWGRYKSAHDIVARDELIERYLPTAQMLAATFYGRRDDDSVEFNDYLQYARIGLIEAIDRYDPAREAKFVTFATYRIRGAILNGIERSTELATQKAQRRRLSRDRIRSLREQPTNTARDPFARMVDLTLQLAIGYLLEESGVWKPGEADRASDPYQSFELKRLCECMGALLTALPERERNILRHHYFEHREFIEIADIMGISKGRVSQLHARSLKLLRESFRQLEGLDKQV